MPLGEPAGDQVRAAEGGQSAEAFQGVATAGQWQVRQIDQHSELVPSRSSIKHEPPASLKENLRKESRKTVIQWP
ncbi:hypothetical protein Acy02nite_35940 [Actinoplanes cyaneus]|uniref:Uncharacterized protein n=1 Tax=Actinoplanes cyaneus TaxID=52696 RepID=A0A919ILN9_9ACTN|nr:hypothetical protein Acy02nite_35940 [Actinoplanes cyaneus]